VCVCVFGISFCLAEQKLSVLVSAPALHYNVHFLNTFAMQFRDAVFGLLLSLKEHQLRDTNTDSLAVSRAGLRTC
jgi:hypothetical protein